MVAAFAFVIRGAHVLFLAREPLAAYRLGDGAVYHEWALAIAGGDWLGSEVFYQAPLYPYFLSVVYRILGSDVLTVRWVQAVLGAIACGVLVLAGSALCSRAVGVAAGLLLSLYAPSVFADALVQKSVLDGLLMAILLWRMGVARSHAGRAIEWQIGATLGVLGLTRENALILAPVLLVWLLGLSDRARVRSAGLFLAGLVTPLLPVAARNYAVGGEFVVTTSQLGPNLYIGNHAGASGLYEPLRAGRGNARFEREDAAALAERELGRALSAAEVSVFWRDRAVEFMATQPWNWLRILGRKAALLTLADELMDTDHLGTHAEWSPVLRGLSWCFGFGGLLALAAFGAVASPRPRSFVVLHVLALLYLASVALFFVSGRYRHPVAPILMLPAAAGVVALGSAGNLARVRCMAGAALAVALAALAHRGSPYESGERSLARFNLGYESQVRGSLPVARRLYEEALHWDPCNADALSNLGALRIGEARADLALPHLERAVVCESDHADAHNHQGIALAMLGRATEAEDAFTASLALMPENAEAQFNLARLLHQQGRLDEAIARYRASLAIRPRNVEAANNLAIALATHGRVAEAERTLVAALGWEPRHPGTLRNLAIVRETAPGK